METEALLFSPFQLASLRLRNRVVMAPLDWRKHQWSSGMAEMNGAIQIGQRWVDD